MSDDLSFQETSAIDPSETSASTGAALSAQLTGAQVALRRALAEEDDRLEAMYLGAISTLAHGANPDRLALAAHGIRELMDNLPRYMDLPVPKKQVSLKPKVRELAETWAKCGNGTEVEESITKGLRVFLRKAKKFFEWFEDEHPTRKDRTAKIISSLDPLAGRLPSRIAQLRRDEWDDCYDYFVAVAHHNEGADDAEFDGWLGALEVFLLDRLRPRTFEDHDLLDDIIAEGEANAE